MERRGRQQLNLVTDTQRTHCGVNVEHNVKQYELIYNLIYNRWTRIRLKAQDSDVIFSNLHTHINFEQWIKKMRNRYKLKEIWSLAISKIRGHINYYGYNMNALKINHFCFQATKSLFKWLNRRSQKRSYTWEGFKERLKHLPLMQPLAKMKLKQLGRSPYV